MSFIRLRPRRGADLVLLLLGVFVLLSIVGFAGYYYYDRYVHQDEKILDSQARHIEEMVAKNPQDPNLRVTVASYYLQGGKADLAASQAQEALKIDPKHQGAMLLLASIATKKGDVAGAVGYYEQLVDLNKDSQMAKMDSRLEGIYYSLGKLYLQQGKYDSSITALKSALEIDRTDADAHYLLGVVYQKQNDHTGALSEFTEALRFDPSFTESYQGLAASYGALGKQAEATYAQGMVAFTQGKNADAAAKLEAATQQSPDLMPAYLGLGLVYESLGKRDQAIAALQKYLAAKPDDLSAKQVLDELQTGSGQ